MKKLASIDQQAQDPSTPGISPDRLPSTKRRVTSIGQQRGPGEHRERPTATTAQVARLPASVSRAVTPQVVEEFRRIKRPLLANAFGKGASFLENGNLIMVTSALPGEGKSSISLNLALNIALERNRTVLLIDADPAKCSLSVLYGLHRAPGLVDILLDDQRALAQAIYRTDLENLSVIPCGKQHAQATELLASDRMESLITDLGQQYPNQVIIFDAPPLLATTEAQVLARLSGQVLLVVEAGRTGQHMVQEAISTLDARKAINLVLNKSQGRADSNHYYQGTSTQQQLA